MSAPYPAARWYARLLTAAFVLQLVQVLWLAGKLRWQPGAHAGTYVLALYLLTPMLLVSGLLAGLEWLWCRRPAPSPGEVSTATVVFIVALLPVLVAAVGWALLFGGL